MPGLLAAHHAGLGHPVQLNRATWPAVAGMAVPGVVGVEKQDQRSGARRDLRNRIGSVGNIKQITRAMEMVATTKLRKFQDRAIGSRPYSQEISGLVGRLVGRLAGRGCGRWRWRCWR